MNVVKGDMVTIPNGTYSEYYTYKRYTEKNHTCYVCKQQGITFKEEDRILSIECPTENCKINMRILEDTYITYDENARRTKEKYEKSIDAILRAKFDRLFDYHSHSNLEKLRDTYLKEREGYDELYMQWQTSDPNHPQLKKERDILIAALKAHNHPNIQKALNEVLDKLHKIEYTTHYNEVARKPIYDLEIRTLDQVSGFKPPSTGL